MRLRRVIDVLRHIALLVADEPEFAGAVTNALLGKDPDVEVLRLRIGRDIHDRLAAALGPDTDPDIIESLEMLYSGALVRAGMGYASYADIAAAVGEVRAADAALARRAAEDRRRGGDGRFDDAAHVARRPRRTAPSAHADRRAGSAPTAARSAAGLARRKPGLSLRSTSMSVRRSIASRCSGSGHRAQRGRLPDPAQRDRRPRLRCGRRKRRPPGGSGPASPPRGRPPPRMLAIRSSLFLRSSSMRHSSLLANCS